MFRGPGSKSRQIASYLCGRTKGTLQIIHMGGPRGRSLHKELLNTYRVTDSVQDARDV